MKRRRLILTVILSTIVFLWITIQLFSSLSVANPSQANISLKTNYYTVKGKTAEELRAHMNRLGPLDPLSNRRYDAYTAWNVQWRYRTVNKNNRCYLHSPTVNTSITMTLPQWNLSANTSGQLKQKWSTYIQALLNHENGHKQHGISAGEEILQLLRQINSYSSCQSLQQAANQTGHDIISKYSQKDIIYDQKTRYGATQGAVFP